MLPRSSRDPAAPTGTPESSASRTAAASRGRDPAFRGAIFGNSQIQLISPEELKARTGIPFVSLIAPATIILERFAFVEGWNLGRGRMWRLLGLLICTWLIYMVIYALVVAVVVVVAFTTGVFAHWQALGEAATLADVLPSPSVLAFLVFLALVPGAFAYGAVMTLLCAPFAAACRELIDGPAVGRRLAVALDS